MTVERTIDDVSAVELPIRAHHWSGTYENLIYTMADKVFAPGETLADFATEYEKEQTEKALFSTSPTWIDPGFRMKYGYAPNDASVPHNYKEDRMGLNPLATVDVRAKPFYEFLSLPDKTPLIMGNVIDNICRSCAFGKGNGGLHCQTLEDPRGKAEEYAQVKAFLRDTSSFFDLNKNQAARYPEGILVIGQSSASFSPFKIEDFYNGADIKTVRTSLGLVRDILTHKVTRYTDQPFDSYQALLTSKGLRAQRS